MMERSAAVFGWSWAWQDILQFSEVSSGCNLLFCTLEMVEGKHSLEGISGVVNSFTRTFEQNGIVVWPPFWTGNTSSLLLSPTKQGHSVFPFPLRIL